MKSKKGEKVCDDKKRVVVDEWDLKMSFVDKKIKSLDCAVLLYCCRHNFDSEWRYFRSTKLMHELEVSHSNYKLLKESILKLYILGFIKGCGVRKKRGGPGVAYTKYWISKKGRKYVETLLLKMVIKK